MHLVLGVELVGLRTPLVQLILRGKENLDEIDRREGKRKVRLPVTPAILKLIKEELRLSTKPKGEKLVLWAAICLSFNGAFRIHEILAKRETSFDPNFTLLGKDLLLKNCQIQGETVRILQVKLKSEKTKRVGAGTIVDVYENGGHFCPVKAYLKMVKSRCPQERDKPAFRKPCGAALTGSYLNAELRSLLTKHLSYEDGAITSHSFRGGMASLMGQLGFGDEDIKAIGRWSSRAYEAYLKLPRTRRVEMARQLGAVLN